MIILFVCFLWHFKPLFCDGALAASKITYYILCCFNLQTLPVYRFELALGIVYNSN